MSIVSNPQAITARSQGIAKVITTPLEVFVPKTKNGVRVSGIWDTGASGTAITSHLVKLSTGLNLEAQLINLSVGHVITCSDINAASLISYLD